MWPAAVKYSEEDRAMKDVFPVDGPKPNGHYVPGMVSHGMVYVSGQLPFDPKTGKLPDGGIRAQMKQALKNVESVIKAAGSDMDCVVQCRIYIPDVKYWDDVNEVYASFFGAHRPARVVVPSSELHRGALCEIEAVAERPEA